MHKHQILFVLFPLKIKKSNIGVTLFIYYKGRNVFMKKKFLRCFLTVLLIAVPSIFIFVIIPKTSDVNTNTLFESVFTFAVCVFVVTLLVSIIFSAFYYIKIQRQLELLEKGEADVALASMKKLLFSLQGSKNKRLENICKINISAAYCDLNEYAKAQEVLDSVDTSALNNNSRFIYEFNSCLCLYYLGSFEKFIELYNEHKEAFNSYKTYKNYKDNIELLEIFYELSCKNYKAAEEKFSILSNKNLNLRLQDDVRALRTVFKELKANNI